MSLVPARSLLRVIVAAALAAFALVALPPTEADAAGAPCQRTFSSDGIPVPIPDEGARFSTIDLPDDGLVVSDLDVTVNLRHPRTADLELTLGSIDDLGQERGTTRLFNHEDGGLPENQFVPAAVEGGLIGTVFDDAAVTPISWGGSPFNGRFVPSKPLGLRSGVTGGKFELVVFDDAVNNSGTLDSWSLVVTYKSCDLDSDGVEDHADQCLDLTARTATGCPVTSRSMSARVKAGKFRGALSSPVAGCKAGRPVSVFRVRAGADARVGTATTRSDGSWRLGRAKKKGRYYASSPRVVVPDAAECPAVTSRAFRIR
jgi:subtilisin-like proprotein convertase family protein